MVDVSNAVVTSFAMPSSGDSVTIVGARLFHFAGRVSVEWFDHESGVSFAAVTHDLDLLDQVTSHVLNSDADVTLVRTSDT